MRGEAVMCAAPRGPADPSAPFDPPAYFDNWAWSQAALDVWLGTQLSPGGLDARRASRLAETVRHAATASPFYRSLYAGSDDPVTAFTRLPVVSKRALMAAFDDWVTDPQVT